MLNVSFQMLWSLSMLVNSGVRDPFIELNVEITCFRCCDSFKFLIKGWPWPLGSKGLKRNKWYGFILIQSRWWVMIHNGFSPLSRESWTFALFWMLSFPPTGTICSVVALWFLLQSRIGLKFVAKKTWHKKLSSEDPSGTKINAY